ncbi:ABC transporter substrate-binding protein [Ammoniphilus sp. 3BR4]|uniref:ABC transporter substrate-binding protein n=1 Tax=Ammoniphilus sp. 3BR4 TaxID=3158265 RepID=UPI00346709D2
MKKHWIRNCLVVCLTLLAVTGCGSSTPSSTPAEAPPAQEGTSAPPPSEPVTVRFSEVIRSIFYAPQYVAMEKGFFEEEGLKVDMVTSQGSDKGAAALLAGTADIWI